MSGRQEAKTVLGESKEKGIIDKNTCWWNENIQKELKEKKNAFKNWQLERGNESERETKRMSLKRMKKRPLKRSL